MNDDYLALIHAIIGAIDAAGTIGVLVVVLLGFYRGDIFSRRAVVMVCDEIEKRILQALEEGARPGGNDDPRPTREDG